MTIHTNDNSYREKSSSKGTKSSAGWMVGIAFIVAVLGALFFYDGRDTRTAPGPHTPNVVNNPSGSK